MKFKPGDIVQFKDTNTFGNAVYKVITIERNNDEVRLTIQDIERENTNKNYCSYFDWRFELYRKEEYLNGV